jgi:NADH-quinone oxidoreductase subunit E
MLTKEELEEIQSEFPKYATKQAVCLEAMKVVQKRRGWVSDESLKDIAKVLNMSVDELDSVATFYNMIYRKPVGRHVIHICNSVSCWIMGYDSLYQSLSKRLGIKMGETTPDGKFTLLPVVCLGACDHAPALMIDRETVGDVSPGKIDDILSKYF